MSLVGAMATAIGNGNIEKGQEAFVKRDKYMTDSAFYTGFSFHWAVQTLGTVGESTSDVPLPDKFLGETTVRGKRTAAVAASTDNPELDMILIENAAGKTDRELKSFAVKNEEIKANTPYLTAVVSGKKLKEMENAGTLTKDPDTNQYL